MWFIFALSAISFFSASAFIDKYVLEKRVPDPIPLVVIAGIAGAVYGFFMLWTQGFPGISMQSILILLLAGILLQAYLIPYMYALLMDDTSLVVPLFQTYPVFTYIIAAVFLGEQLSSHQLLGFVMIFVAGFLLTIERFDMTMFKPRKQLYLMLIASLCIALSGVLFKSVIATTGFWTGFGYELLGGAIVSVILLLITSYRKRVLIQIKKLWSSTGIIMLINDVVNFLGEYLMNYAYFLAPAALVSVTASFSPVFLLIFGLILSVFFPHIIKEDIQKETIIKKIILFVFLILGAIFIS